MILLVQCMKIIKYTFDVPVAAMVSQIIVKSRMAVNYVTIAKLHNATSGDAAPSRWLGSQCA